MERRNLSAWLIALALMPVFTGPAAADAIDGHWCYGSRHLAIKGSTILTPGGKSMTGKYDRHAFLYTAPAGETEAGSQVFMVLRDEETMERRVGTETAPAQVWRRCTAPSS